MKMLTGKERYEIEKKDLLGAGRYLNLQVGDNDLIGNKFNGHDLHFFLQNRGISSFHYVRNKQSSDPTTICIPEVPSQNYAQQVIHSKEFLLSDIVHLHLIHNTNFDINYLPILTALKPTIITLHDPYFFGGHCIHNFGCNKWKEFCYECPYLQVPFHRDHDLSAYEFLMKKLAVQSSRISVIVASKWMEELVRQSPVFTGIKIYRQPFGIDQSVFSSEQPIKARRKLGIDPEAFVILFRADTNPFKGLPLIIEALSKLNPEKKIVLLTVSQKGLVPRALYDRFTVLEFGWVYDDNSLAALYQASDILLMPSKQEAFGMMAIEAMSCGKMVLCTIGTALQDVVHSPECGIATTESEFSTTLQMLVNDKDLVHQYGVKALRYAQEHYSASQYVDGIIQIYDDVINRFESTPVSTAANEQLFFAAMQIPISSDISSQQQDIINDISSQKQDIFNDISLYQSNSWRITKPIRAFIDAWRMPGGLKKKILHFEYYIRDENIDKKNDATILVSKCWKLTKPLRALKSKFERK
jgi:glycosyltransferase involved in cell wall biosynthesis